MSEYLIDRARRLACEAHAGQRDKAGEAYILHVARVAEAVRGHQDAEVVAWLHDVMEDCGDEYIDRLYSFPGFIVRWCTLLNRGTQATDEAYYRWIKSDPVALKVKLADIADNANEARLALLDEKTADRLRRKYMKARAMLECGQ